jgi:hypothetical protein
MLNSGGIVKLPIAVALGLTAAALVTGGISAQAAQGTTGRTGTAGTGRNCTALSLTSGHPVSGYAVPSVCVVRDTVGQRFYLFSGVFRYVAGQPVQADFPVANSLQLKGIAMVPVIGYAGSNPASTYAGWGQIRPDGKIRIYGPKPGWTYTLTISGQIPVGIPAAR